MFFDKYYTDRIGQFQKVIFLIISSIVLSLISCSSDSSSLVSDEESHSLTKKLRKSSKVF